MKRRTFFKWMLAVVPHVFVPRWVFAQAGQLPSAESATLRELASVVLPASLGTVRLDAAVKQFDQWVREYRAGAEMSAGYGVTRIQTVAANPSVNYSRQLRELETAAQARGSAFARHDPSTKRTLVGAALEAAGIDNLPRRPDGGHVATDLMSHFFLIDAAGQDWLYNASIQRAVCRGLASSAHRPATLV